MKKIKKYYRIEFKLTSPLSVGSGGTAEVFRIFRVPLLRERTAACFQRRLPRITSDLS